MINFDRFPNNKRKALTMSYDDGKRQDRRLVSLFDRYGIRGAFHINSGLLEDSERVDAGEIKTLYKNHEISAHGYTHQSLSITPNENIAYEIMTDRMALEKIAGYPVRGMSYPNGLYNDTVINVVKSLGIEYSRIVQAHGKFALPSDFFRWGATCHHNENLLALTDEFLAIPYKNRPHLMYVWGHSYEFDRDNNWDLIETFCERISNREDIWYATNIEIVDYMNAVSALKFSADLSMAVNLSAVDVWISVDEEPVILPAGKTTYL